MTDGLLTVVEVEAYDPSRSNLLGYSRQFDNAYWTKAASTITANAALGHDNQMLADKLVENSATADHYIQSPTLTGFNTAQFMTLSVYAKAVERSKLWLGVYSGASFSNLGRVIFDLAAGTVAGATTGTATVWGSLILPQGNGWWRCVVYVTPESSNSGQARVRLQLVNPGTTYAGDGSSGLLIDRVLFEARTAVGAPIDTTTAGPGLRRYYWSDRPFVTGSTSIPPHQPFDPRVRTAPSFTRRAFADPRTVAGAAASGGVLELVNTDHALAGLLDMGIAGRAITVRVGPPEGAYPTDFTTWLTGVVEQVEVGVDAAVLRIRDRIAILDQPLQATKYAGNNSLPSGAEGVATDIGGQPKPKAWGKALQVPLVLVNTSLLIYQATDGPMQAVDAVYDKGAPLTASGTDRANLAALESATIAAGQYDTCLALGLVRLGGSAAGRVTADIRGDAAGSYVDRVGAICRRILETVCGVPTAEIDTASFAALDAAANYESGMWVGGEASRRDVLAALAGSVGAWVVPSATGIWTAGRIEAPSGAADLTLTDVELVDLDRVAPPGDDAGLPVWRVTVRHSRHWTIQAVSDLAAPPAITEARRSELAQEWRTTTATDAAIQTAHPLAVALDRDTCLLSASDAAAERDRLLALYKVRRDMVRCRVPLLESTAAADVGARVDIVSPALGYGAGRSFVVAGVTRDARSLELMLWG